MATTAVCVCVCVYVCVCVCVRACVRACVSETERERERERKILLLYNLVLLLAALAIVPLMIMNEELKLDSFKRLVVSDRQSR